LHRLRYQKPDSSFRTHYAYTNFGITEAGIAVTKAVNLAWENASQQKLYGPLGMNSTSSRYSDFLARINKALGHVRENGQWVQKYKRDPDAESPAGGVSSSVNDVARWMRLELANGQLEGKQLVDEKAPVISLGKTLAVELAGRGVRINVLSPGPIDTPILKKAGLPPEQMKAFEEEMVSKSLLKRFGTSEEVARAARFLLSEDSSNIIGTELVIDGGVRLN
jgi:CubicO group peptidase (beta-lactamase class C family)